MKFMKLFAAFLVACAVIFSAVLFSRVSTEVVAQKVKKQSCTPHLSVKGTVEETDYVMLSPAAAVVSNVLVKKGQTVRAGQTLCTVDAEATQTISNVNKASSVKSICADKSGKITSVDVKKGDTLKVGEAVICLKSGEGKQVTALVGESGISDVDIGQKAVITGSGFKGKSYNATVVRIADKAQKVSVGSVKSVAVEVFLYISNPDEDLKSGFTARADIFTANESFKPVVPYSAVMQDDGGEYVFVCNNGRAEKKYIKTAEEQKNGYEVLGGLSEGETVVINPLVVKKNGQRVSVSLKEEG